MKAIITILITLLLSGSSRLYGSSAEAKNCKDFFSIIPTAIPTAHEIFGNHYRILSWDNKNQDENNNANSSQADQTSKADAYSAHKIESTDVNSSNSSMQLTLVKTNSS